MELNNFPLVSIGVLCYNTGKYAIEALECIKRQNYPNIELFIIDDCSTDGISVNLIQDWLDKNSGCEFDIKVNFRKKNEGVHSGLNEIVEKSTGKYLNFISDDLWTDDKLLTQVKKLEELGDEYALFYGDIRMIDENSTLMDDDKQTVSLNINKPIPIGDIFKENINEFIFWIQASTIRLDLLKKIKYTFNNKYISEDWHLSLSISRNYKIYGERRIFAYYRWLNTSIGRTYWVPEKIHIVYFSQFQMIKSFYRHPKNNSIDKKIIIDRSISLLDSINYNNFNKKKKMIFSLIDLIIVYNINFLNKKNIKKIIKLLKKWD